MNKLYRKSLVVALACVAMNLSLTAMIVFAADPSPSPSVATAVSSVAPVLVETPATIQMPAWIVSAIHALQAIPAIGHLLVAILGVLAIATPILTSLTALLMAIEKAFNLTGLIPEINFLNQKVIPWVAMFSNLNVQAPTSKSPTDVSVSVVAAPVSPSDSKS